MDHMCNLWGGEAIYGLNSSNIILLIIIVCWIRYINPAATASAFAVLCIYQISCLHMEPNIQIIVVLKTQTEEKLSI